MLLKTKITTETVQTAAIHPGSSSGERERGNHMLRWPLEKQLVFGYVTFFLRLFLGKPEPFSRAEWRHKTQHNPLKD